MTKKKEVTAEVEALGVIETYWKQFVIGLAVVLVGWGSYLVYGFLNERAEKSAQEELFTIQKAIEKKTDELTKPATVDEKGDKADEGKTKKTAADTKNNKAPVVIPKTPESFQKNFGEYAKQYEEFIKRYSGRKASYMAAVQLAGLAGDYKSYDVAEKALSSVADKVSPSDVFFGLLRAQLGTVLMELKKYPEAAEEFGKIVNNKSQSYFHAHALLRMSVCYLEIHEWDKAQATLKRVETDYPQTQAAVDAKNYMKLLMLKRGEKS